MCSSTTLRSTARTGWFHDRPQNEVVICIMVNVLELLGMYPDAIVVKRRAIKMNNMLVGGVGMS